MEPAQRAQYLKQLQDSLVFDYIFRANHTYQLLQAGGHRGTWKSLSHDGRTLTIQMNLDGMDFSPATMKFDDNDHFTMTWSDKHEDIPITFTRVR
jgi:hypothetical protein